jgi:hypothetical protein
MVLRSAGQPRRHLGGKRLGAARFQVYVQGQLLHGGGQVAVARLYQFHQAEQPLVVRFQHAQTQFQGVARQHLAQVGDMDVHRVDAAARLAGVVRPDAVTPQQLETLAIEHAHVVGGIHMAVFVDPIGFDGQGQRGKCGHGFRLRRLRICKHTRCQAQASGPGRRRPAE